MNATHASINSSFINRLWHRLKRNARNARRRNCVDCLALELRLFLKARDFIKPTIEAIRTRSPRRLKASPPRVRNPTQVAPNQVAPTRKVARLNQPPRKLNRRQVQAMRQNQRRSPPSRKVKKANNKDVCIKLYASPPERFNVGC